MRWLFVPLLIVALLLVGVGCDLVDALKLGNELFGSMEWAVEIAQGIRDSELPSAYLIAFYAMLLNDDGVIGQDVCGANWQYDFYHDHSRLNVTVDSSGGTVQQTYPSDYTDELPTYDNEKLATWIGKADDSVGEDTLAYEYRALRCREDGGVNTVYVWYYDINNQLVASVKLNADTDAIIP